VKGKYETYLVTQTDKDNNAEAFAHDRWLLVLETTKMMAMLVLVSVFLSPSANALSRDDGNKGVMC
jgi:hypothetical protein